MYVKTSLKEPGRRLYRLATEVYLERFDAEALLLVADRNRLLTVNAAAADLFAETVQSFNDRTFTQAEASDRLANHFDLPAQQCRTKTRELLAFGLRHGLVLQNGR